MIHGWMKQKAATFQVLQEGIARPAPFVCIGHLKLEDIGNGDFRCLPPSEAVLE